MKCRRYARVLANYPYIIVGVVSAVSITCLVIILTAASKPDFTDPKLGFEARGTELSARIRSHEKLLDNTYGMLTRTSSHFISTSELGSEQDLKYKQNSSASKLKHRKKNDRSETRNHLEGNVTINNDFFCDIPRTDYARYTYTSMDGFNLFTLENIAAICRVDEAIASQNSFENLCVKQHVSDSKSQCCRSWSLASYVMLLHNRTSCFHLTHKDVELTVDLLQECIVYYDLLLFCSDDYDFKVSDVEKEACDAIPPQCLRSNAVYQIFHYIIDINFVTKQNVGQSLKLTYAMTFIPLAVGKSTKELYSVITDDLSLSHDPVRITGINFGLKQIMFDEYLKKDSVWFALALSSVVVLMWIFTASIFITIMAIINMAFTLIISYFIYTVIFEIDFFPYMNLMAVVLLIGVGVDDVFLYCRIWNLAKFEKNVGTLEKIISDTLKHATLSMFVTSVTTSAAIYANMVNKITALKCFAIFGGTTILVNFIVMITWIPATIVLHNKWCSNCCACQEPEHYGNNKNRVCLYNMCKLYYKIFFYISEWSRTFFEKVLPYAIVKLRFVWIFLFGMLSILGVVAVLYYPKLKLPKSNEFQMFAQNHPFEVYDFLVKDQFWFEKAAGTSVSTVPLTVIWGVKPQDTGNKFDPYSETELEYDKEFNINTQDGQRYLLKFCRELRSSTWYQKDTGPQLANCFIEGFTRYMDRPCESPVGSYFPCCDQSVFPFTQSVYSQCLEEWMMSVEKSRHLYYVHPTAGPRFDKETGEIVAVIAEFNSKQPYSFNYENMSEFYASMNSWMNTQMKLAPKGLTGAWFVSDLGFLDLQQSLATGIPIAIGVSIAIATIFAFITTLNVLITVWSIVCITGTIFTVIGLLVLLGWELNIMESVTLTVAVGLAIDFTLHYGMAYRLSPDIDREPRMLCATQRVGSVVAAAALSTFTAGLFMLPSYIEAYRQLGTFIMIIMSFSWLYATFFFQSLLHVFGPIGGFSQFHCFSINCCDYACCSGEEHIDKTVYTMTESTTTSSSSTTNNHINSNSEIHELEPLTENDNNMNGRHGGPVGTHITKSSKHFPHSAAILMMNNNPNSSTEVVFDDNRNTSGLYQLKNGGGCAAYRHKSEESQDTCRSLLSSEDTSPKSPPSEMELVAININNDTSNRVMATSSCNSITNDNDTTGQKGPIYAFADVESGGDEDNSGISADLEHSGISRILEDDEFSTVSQQNINEMTKQNADAPLVDISSGDINSKQQHNGSNNNVHEVVWVKKEIFV